MEPAAVMCSIKVMSVQSPGIENTGFAATAVPRTLCWTRRVTVLGLGDGAASATPGKFVGSTKAAHSRSAASLC